MKSVKINLLLSSITLAVLISSNFVCAAAGKSQSVRIANSTEHKIWLKIEVAGDNCNKETTIDTVVEPWGTYENRWPKPQCSLSSIHAVISTRPGDPTGNISIGPITQFSSAFRARIMGDAKNGYKFYVLGPNEQ